MRFGLSLHATIRLLMLVIFGILVYQVTAASLRPPISTRLYGSDVVWPGQTALFRVLCLDTDGISACAAPHIDAQWVAIDAQGVWQTKGPLLEADPHGALRVAMPAPLPGNLALSVHVRDGARTPVDHLVVRLGAAQDIAGAAGHMRAPIVLQGGQMPSVHAELWPDDGSVIAGLRATGVGRIVRDDAQTRAETLTGGHGFVPEPASDAAGHFSWHAQPQLKRAPWQLWLAPAAPPLEAHVAAEPRQLSLRLCDGPYVAAGHALRFALRTLPFRGPVHIDLWLGRALIAGADVAQGQHSLALPPDVQGPLMLTAYRQSLAPDDTHVTQVGWVYPGTQPYAADTDGLAHWLGITPGPQASWEVKAKQGMFVPQQWGAPLLADTHAARQNAFTAAQTQRRKLGQNALVTTLSFGSFCALGYLRHFMSRRRAKLAAAIDAEGPSAARAMTHVGLANWLWPAVGILLLMGAGLWQLMGHLVALP